MKQALRKRFAHVSAAASLALILTLIISSLALAYVGTDQADYQPGSVVTISGNNSDGSGFQPGESIHVVVTGNNNGYTAECDATANEASEWSCQVTLWADDAAVDGYSYTASNADGSHTETGTFTDGKIDVALTLSSISTPLTPGQTNVTYNFTASPVPTGGDFKLDYVPGSSCSGNFSSTGTDPTGSNGNYSGTFTAPTTPGTYSYRVHFNPAGGSAYGNSFSDCQSITVNPPTPVNTAPTVTVSGVTAGTNYELGTVLSATCLVTDKEDGDKSFPATLSAVTGPLALYGLGSQTASCSYTDVGGLTASASVTYTFVDTISPIITASISPAAPNNGWYNSEVTISWSCTDTGGSGVASVSDSTTLNSDGANQSVTGTCTDHAGNTISSAQTVNIDTTPPSITLVSRTQANSAGWNNDNVTIEWSCADSGSGVVNPSVSKVLSDEGINQSATGTCTDNAGNSVSNTQNGINIDKTAPTNVKLIASGWNGNDGWFIGDVTITTSSDPDLSPVTCTPDQSQTAETKGTDFNGSCTNAAGLTTNAAPLSVKLDKTAPANVQLIANGTPGTNGWFTSDVTITTTGGDSISGIMFCTADQTQSEETAGTRFDGFCTNAAGLKADADPLTIKVDKTAPTGVKLTAAGPIGNDGWFTGDVTVTTTSDEDLSEVICTPSTQNQTTDTTGTEFNASCINEAGLYASADPITVKLDKTAPTFTVSVSPAVPTSGWYNLSTGAPTVSFKCSDATSGLKESCPASYAAPEGVSPSTSFTIYDQAGNKASAPVGELKIDLTKPTIQAAATTQPNAFGWYTSDVTVHFTCADGLSGLSSTACPADQLLSTESAATSSTAQTVTDIAGNTSEPSNIVTVQLDKTAPTEVKLTAAGTAGINGWFTGDVTITTTGVEDVSGPVSCTALQYQTQETAENQFSGTCTNQAGLTSAPATLTVKLDKTAPTNVKLTAAGLTGNAGWFIGDVTVTTSSDSDLSAVTCTAVQSQTSDTTGAAFDGSCVNEAGLSASAAQITVKLDKTAPTIAWNGAIDAGSSFYFGSVPAVPTCTASDATSGPKDCAVSGYSTAVGSHTMTATAHDNAGNIATETRAYTVLAWTLNGFYQPVDMNGVFNVVKNGSTVPLKFEIFAGPTELTSTSVVASLKYGNVACSATAPQDAIETTATGGTALRYDAAAGQFVYNWKTPSVTGCYSVTMTTLDGSKLSAFFKLK